ncbi:HDOD domain-containing protein, partial [Thermodesulfobacteriota bacterium]
ANILRLCNSSYYSLSREIASLNDAVVLLGNQTLFNLILTSFSSNKLGKSVKGYGLEKGGLWEHSISCAILAREIAHKVGFKDIQLAYSTGLMHDTGKLILDKFLHENAAKVMEISNKEDVDFTKIEEDLLGVNHATVGGLLAEEWKFPQAIVDGIKFHHTPLDATENRELVNIIHVADSLSVTFGFGGGVDGLSYRFYDSALDELSLDKDQFEDYLSTLIDELDKASEIIKPPGKS